MKWIDSLEAKFGRFAVPGLTRMIVALNVLVFVIARLNHDYISWLVLDRESVLHGQVWRLVTYIFIPPTLSLIWIIFAMQFIWLVGEGLEHAWGAFKLNLFYLCGMIGC